MLTLIGYLVLGAALIALLFAGGMYLMPKGEQVAPPVRDEPHWAIAQGRPVTGDDVDSVRLPVALRGYRFAETDQLLDTLANELRWRDAELTRLGYYHGPAPDLSAQQVSPAEPVEYDEGQPEHAEPVEQPEYSEQSERDVYAAPE